MIALVFLALVASSYAAVAPSTNQFKNSFSEEDKQRLMQDLEDEELAKQVEALIGNLDGEQLEKLEAILSRDLDLETELSLIQDELNEMGMEIEDINDLLDLASMMTQFLSKVPEIDLGQDEYSLEDHVKLYLLGLPNRLGPLGFVALHSVLQTDEDIVDVKIEGFEATNEGEPAQGASVTPLGDIIARKRRESQQRAAKAPHAHQAPHAGQAPHAHQAPHAGQAPRPAAHPAPQKVYQAPPNSYQVPLGSGQAAHKPSTIKNRFASGSADIVAEIKARRKRSIH